MRLTGEQLDLGYVLRALRRKLPILIIAALTVPGVAYFLSDRQEDKYTASAKMLFRDPQFDQRLFGNFSAPILNPDRRAATDLELLSLPHVAELAARRLDMTEDQVRSAISVEALGQADIFAINAESRVPLEAARIANEYAKSFVAFRLQTDVATIRSAREELEGEIEAATEPNSPLRKSLQQLQSRLDVVGSLQTGKAEVVQPASVPESPSSPKPVRDAGFGLFFGLLLGVALAILAQIRDRRIRDVAEFEHIFHRPLLTVLARSAALERSDPALRTAAEVDREAFRMLWVSLRYFTATRNIRSVLITSPDRDDGKSTVAWGLAVAAASAGTKTLLIEADLRNTTLAARHQAPTTNGLTNVLIGDIDHRDAIVSLNLPVSKKGGAARAFDVLFAGPPPPDPTDLLQSQRMIDFLRKVEDEYELVILDSPPAAIVSDTIPLMSMVRGVVVVGRVNNTMRDHAQRLRHQCDQLDVPTLGIVVNAVERTTGYGYYYRSDGGYRELGDGDANGGAERGSAPVSELNVRAAGERQ
jgi:capsular exopolysaccharide synthesis family protein